MNIDMSDYNAIRDHHRTMPADRLIDALCANEAKIHELVARDAAKAEMGVADAVYSMIRGELLRRLND